jgi:hypothetical protein
VVVQIEGASYRLRIRAKALIDPASALAIPPQKRRGRPGKVADITTSAAATLPLNSVT